MSECMTTANSTETDTPSLATLLLLFCNFSRTSRRPAKSDVEINVIGIESETGCKVNHTFTYWAACCPFGPCPSNTPNSMSLKKRTRVREEPNTKQINMSERMRSIFIEEDEVSSCDASTSDSHVRIRSETNLPSPPSSDHDLA